MDLINKEVEVTDLLNSKIFNHVFDFDEWPATNPNVETIMKPYNNSIFSLRQGYANIFRNIWLNDEKIKVKQMKGLKK